MSSTSIRTFRALQALAHIELGEAALQLADRLDEQARAKEELGRREDDARQLLAVYERMSQPGAPLYVGALGALARQSRVSQSVLQEAQAASSTAEQELDEHRQIVHRQQTRYESLSGFLKDALKAHASEREKAASLEREDLFVVRRHLLEGRA